MSSPFPGDAAIIVGNATSNDMTSLQPLIDTNKSKISPTPINDTNQTNQTIPATVDNP